MPFLVDLRQRKKEQRDEIELTAHKPFMGASKAQGQICHRKKALGLWLSPSSCKIHVRLPGDAIWASNREAASCTRKDGDVVSGAAGKKEGEKEKKKKKGKKKS